MIGLVVACHSRLAEELLLTAESIVGPLPHARAVCIRREEGMEAIEATLRAAIAAVDDAGDGVIVMTDMFGGTPANVAMTLFEDCNIEILAGVNLPMLIKFSSVPRCETLSAVAVFLREYGRRGIMCPGELLNPRTDYV
ncbi:MAG: PTS system fructose subfamily IIA component [Desulfuromonadales bacterium]|nr:PTS system fructose subfamily IIA component [Desulfuromonadales bacterium]MDT8423819.1 PTS system fructose subfamily IIA component [Desulfuromonadales bacterium]